MNICELLEQGGILCFDGVVDYRSLFSEAIPKTLKMDGVVLSWEDIFSKILDRETQQKGITTVLGNGVAIPHANFSGIQRPFVKLVILKEGIYYFSDFCDIFFIVVDSGGSVHVNLLAKVARIFHNDKDFAQRLRRVDSPEEAFKLLEAQERKEASA